MEDIKQAAVLFSGGMDSFLVCCRLIEHGFSVFLITCDNGCISNIDAVYNTKDRLENMYGHSKVCGMEIHNIAEPVYVMKKHLLRQEIQKISQKYPHLQPLQVNCLICHTCMFTDALKYAKEHNIQYVADESRKSQGFIIELPEIAEKYKAFAYMYGVKYILPVYEMEDDIERKSEFASRGFIPKTIEPQCWIGMPMKSELNFLQIKDLVDFYEHEIKDLLLRFV